MNHFKGVPEIVTREFIRQAGAAAYIAGLRLGAAVVRNCNKYRLEREIWATCNIRRLDESLTWQNVVTDGCALRRRRSLEQDMYLWALTVDSSRVPGSWKHGDKALTLMEEIERLRKLFESDRQEGLGQKGWPVVAKMALLERKLRRTLKELPEEGETRRLFEQRKGKVGFKFRWAPTKNMLKRMDRAGWGWDSEVTCWETTSEKLHKDRSEWDSRVAERAVTLTEIQLSGVLWRVISLIHPPEKLSIAEKLPLLITNYERVEEMNQAKSLLYAGKRIKAFGKWWLGEEAQEARSAYVEVTRNGKTGRVPESAIEQIGAQFVNP